MKLALAAGLWVPSALCLSTTSARAADHPKAAVSGWLTSAADANSRPEDGARSDAALATHASSRTLPVRGSPFRNLSQSDWERQQREAHSPTQSNLFFFVVAGTAAVVMWLTLSSMSSRWLNDLRAKARIQSDGIVPPAPVLAALASVTRPLRIDANQPRTRLEIDLAMLERARQTSAASEPSPKAA